jgi:hypothetical protein
MDIDASAERRLVRERSNKAFRAFSGCHFFFEVSQCLDEK